MLSGDELVKLPDNCLTIGMRAASITKPARQLDFSRGNAYKRLSNHTGSTVWEEAAEALSSY